MLLGRGLYSDVAPPEARSRYENNPSLLYSWWCTCFSIVIILFRLGGRYVRSERLFREDGIMALSIIPLLIRMGFVHVILLYGTNNVASPDTLGELEVQHRQIGSGLVLASRVFYAMFIWTAKFTITEFLRRMTATFWKREFEIALKVIRWFLLVTFVAVVIATISECQPFNHYWQVTPDPGPQCRMGYAQLITMGTTDIITDALLIIFPIPVIFQSAIPLNRKFKLVCLFGLSAILVGVAGARMPYVIRAHGRQQYRTVWASTEILLATGVSNAVVLGSFLRDRGVKKRKFKFGSASESIDQGSLRRPTIARRRWGSDEDLFSGTGIRLEAELYDAPAAPRPAPMAAPATPATPGSTPYFVDKAWHPNGGHDSCRESEESDIKHAAPTDPTPTQRGRRPSRRVSFFDVGGLLEGGGGGGGSVTSSTPMVSNPSSPTDDELSRRGRPRGGSRALLADLGGLFAPSHSRSPQPAARAAPRSMPNISHDGAIELSSRPPPPKPHRPTDSPPTGVLGPHLNRHVTANSLQDVGGLLEEARRSGVSPRAIAARAEFPIVELSQPPPPRRASAAARGAAAPASPSPGPSRAGRKESKSPSRRRGPSTGRRKPALKKKRSAESLQDVGGLLSGD